MSKRHTAGSNSDGAAMIYIHFFLKQIVKNTHASKAEQTDTL